MDLTPEEKAAAKAAKEAEKAAAKAAKDAEKAAADAKKAEVTEITVTWTGGSRVYSKDVHGDNFAALADEFVATHADKHAQIVA